MGYDEFLLTVNASAIIILLALASLLCAATRFRGESSYAACIIVFTTVPVYLYNLCRSLQWYDVAFVLAPVGYSVNLTLMPLLWLFVQRSFNPGYRFRALRLLHFLPAVACLALFCAEVFTLPASQRYGFMEHENTGDDTRLGDVNYALLLAQVVAYFTLIFRYLRRAKRYIRENYSDAQWLHKLWIPRLITLFASLFVVVMVCYFLWPRTDAWLIQVLNVVAMGYLIYKELTPATAQPAGNEEKESRCAPGTDAAADREETELLRGYAETVCQYLQTSGVYTNPDLSLRDVAQATGISSNNLSKAINAVLGKNFFELVNGMRIEKSKTLLLEKKERLLTIETIAEQCGFNSPSIFCRAFKKSMGMTTSQWLKSSKND